MNNQIILRARRAKKGVAPRWGPTPELAIYSLVNRGDIEKLTHHNAGPL